MLRILLIGLTIISVTLFIRLWVGTGSSSEIWEMREQIEERKAANKAQQEENRRLQAEIGEFKSGNTIIEERARSELGFIRKGEKFYQIILQPEPEQPTPTPNDPQSKEKENNVSDYE